MINIIVVSFLAVVGLSYLLVGWQVILPIAALIFIASKVWPGDDRPVQHILDFVLYSFYTWIPAAGVGMLLGSTKQEQGWITIIVMSAINIWLISHMNRKP